MPVPYRKTPRAAEIGVAAYLHILWLPTERIFCGGLLITDGKGQPQEFVHNVLSAPTGLLWTDEQTWQRGLPILAHSLFDACRREPDLLVALDSLGPADFLSAEVAPSIPFAQVVPPRDGLPAEWNWINTPPSSGMRASVLAQELIRRGFLVEPFERLREALSLVYPDLAFPPENPLATPSTTTREPGDDA